MIRGWNKSIFGRLMIGYVGTVLLGLCAAGILVAYFTNTYISEAKQTELMHLAKRVNLAIQEHPVADDQLKDILAFFDQSYDTRIWLFDVQGKIVATSTKDEVTLGKSVDASVADRISQGQDTVLRLHFEGLKQPMLSVVVPWGEDDRIYGGIVLHAPVTGIHETIAKLREMILLVILVVLLISVLVASSLSWTISKPLRTMEKAAGKIGMGDFGERIVVPAQDEIGELADSFNQMADKLEQLGAEQRRLERMRHDFLANVSHELRTPLTAMLGFVEALQDDLIEEQNRKRYYDIIYNETVHMNRLVGDITDLVKLENHEIALIAGPVDMQAILDKTKLLFDSEVAEKGLSLVVQTSEEPVVSYADPDRLLQIVNNLVKNAIKFSEKGTVTLAASVEGEGVQLLVQDQGIGIADAELPLIWERFFKADRGRARRDQGSGLGLSIVRELVELHGGTIQVESEAGKGSTFRVSLPRWREA